jgi:hypothetical protein
MKITDPDNKKEEKAPRMFPGAFSFIVFNRRPTLLRFAIFNIFIISAEVWLD